MIIDLLKTSTQNKTAVTSFSVGTFVLDCQLEEVHNSNLTVTDNPIESGAVIADHSYLEPKQYAVQGLIVSYEPSDKAATSKSNLSILTQALLLPSGIASAIDQSTYNSNRYGSSNLNIVDSGTRQLAAWLPSSLGYLGDNAETVSRYEKIYNDLLTIQKSGELLEVTSGLMRYINMQLVGVSARKGTDDSVELTLDFKEVHIVQTRTVNGLVVNVPQVKSSSTSTPMPSNSIKTGRSADQAAKPKAKGRTNPTKKDDGKASVLKRIFS